MEIKSVTILQETDQAGLFISGSAAGRNVLYTCEELERQEKNKCCRFSVYDNHEDAESKDIEEGRGFPLQNYLDAACVTDTEEIRLKSVDGFESIVTELKSKRYYFPKLREGMSEGREPREAFISFYKNGIPVKYYPHPTIMFGQQGLDDKNKDYFSKGIRMLVAGSQEQGFWVRGNGLRCNRYFSLGSFFELNKAEAGTIYWMELKYADGSHQKAPAIRLTRSFWEEQAECAPEYMDQLRAVDHAGETIGNVTDAIWLFLLDETYKRIGYYDGTTVSEDFAGIVAGELEPIVSRCEKRVPQTTVKDSDFYIRIRRQGQELATWYYSFAELQSAYGDVASEEEYCYYNHNMNNGQGGQRKVTAHGLLLLNLLEFLPQIPDREEIENGSVLFQIFTNDNYKEKIMLSADELSAYRFILAYEQDQRTQTGAEPGDTSLWEDAERRFVPIRGTTPFRVYCGKESANPSVYKNVAGMQVELLF